jgi:hypothetical protein
MTRIVTGKDGRGTNLERVAIISGMIAGTKLFVRSHPPSQGDDLHVYGIDGISRLSRRTCSGVGGDVTPASCGELQTLRGQIRVSEGADDNMTNKSDRSLTARMADAQFRSGHVIDCVVT